MTERRQTLLYFSSLSERNSFESFYFALYAIILLSFEIKNRVSLFIINFKIRDNFLNFRLTHIFPFLRRVCAPHLSDSHYGGGFGYWIILYTLARTRSSRGAYTPQGFNARQCVQGDPVSNPPA